MAARILLVEDFVPFRSLVAGMLRDGTSNHTVREAGDGAEAVAIAKEFRPEVILMDIGLPSVNGFEAARKILEHLPSSKIVFLTVETDQEIVQEAMSLGACGYITKYQVRSELLTGVAAVLEGEGYLCSAVR